MEMYASCDCGWTARGDESEVHETLREHGIEVHGIELSDEQIRAVSRPVTTGDPSQEVEDRE